MCQGRQSLACTQEQHSSGGAPSPQGPCIPIATKEHLLCHPHATGSPPELDTRRKRGWTVYGWDESGHLDGLGDYTRSSAASRKTEKLLFLLHLSWWTEVCTHYKGSLQGPLTAHLRAEAFGGSGPLSVGEPD